MLSVVIATQDSEQALLPTLAALVPGATATLVREVLIADGGSRDATTEIAEGAGCDVLLLQAPLAQRLKAAAAKARAGWLMFLPPGSVPDPTWVGDVARFTEENELRRLSASRAAVFRSSTSGEPSMLGEALSLLRRALGGKPRREQGLIIHRQLYDSVGGHRLDVSDPEADLISRLGRRRITLLRSGAMLLTFGDR